MREQSNIVTHPFQSKMARATTPPFFGVNSIRAIGAGVEIVATRISGAVVLESEEDPSVGSFVVASPP